MKKNLHLHIGIYWLDEDEEMDTNQAWGGTVPDKSDLQSSPKGLPPWCLFAPWLCSKYTEITFSDTFYRSYLLKTLAICADGL
jgi:hypothetical protein